MNNPFLTSRLILHVFQICSILVKLEDCVSKAVSHYTLDIVAPRVISFEDQVQTRDRFYTLFFGYHHYQCHYHLNFVSGISVVRLFICIIQGGQGFFEKKTYIKPYIFTKQTCKPYIFFNRSKPYNFLKKTYKTVQFKKKYVKFFFKTVQLNIYFFIINQYILKIFVIFIHRLLNK